MEDGTEYNIKMRQSMKMPAMDLILTNGTVVDPFNNIHETEVGIRGKRLPQSERIWPGIQGQS